MGPKQPICPEQIFLGYKPLLLLSSTYGPFHCAKFKRNLTMDTELWRCTIFGPKVVHLPLIIFFSENLLMSLVSFIHAYLHAKNQSQVLIYFIGSFGPRPGSKNATMLLTFSQMEHLKKYRWNKIRFKNVPVSAATKSGVRRL